MTDSMTEFLQELWGFKPENLNILIWQKKGKKSYWFTDIDKIVNYLEKNKDQSDIYVGVGLSPKDYGLKNRCPANEIAGITGFWSDIDIQNGVHKKKNLPASVEEAKSLFPEEPTCVIHSGHGIQAWWLFREPWIFDNEDERLKAQAMCEAWHRQILDRAEVHDWTVDATFDLSRILRIPGTKNLKNKDDVRDVKLIASNWTLRYEPDDLVPSVVVEKGKKENIKTDRIVLRPDAAPPTEKWEALMSAEPKFKRSWNHDRKDLSDQSPSSYDFSLASIAFQAEWTDQEIVDLLIAHRRRHKVDLKLRKDYYLRTLEKLKLERLNQERINEMLEIQSQKITETKIALMEASNNDTSLEHSEILARLEKILGVRIERLQKFLSEPPSYRLQTVSTNISIESAGDIISQTKFRIKIADATGVVIRPFKKDEWSDIAQLILNACEEIEVGEESTEIGFMNSLLRKYLRKNTNFVVLKSLEEYSEKIQEEGFPFSLEGYTYISLSELRRFIRVSSGDLLTTKQVGKLLRMAGWVNCKLDVIIDGKRTSRSLFKIKSTASELS
ncbi:MAG: hypothetical protein WC262_11490 [Bacteroidales bacterium]